MDYKRLLPGGPRSSEGSTVGPMVLSLALSNNLVLNMSSQIGKTLAKRRTQKLEITEICPSRRVGHFKAPC